MSWAVRVAVGEGCGEGDEWAVEAWGVVLGWRYWKHPGVAWGLTAPRYGSRGTSRAALGGPGASGPKANVVPGARGFEVGGRDVGGTSRGAGGKLPVCQEVDDEGEEDVDDGVATASNGPGVLLDLDIPAEVGGTAGGTEVRGPWLRRRFTLGCSSGLDPSPGSGKPGVRGPLDHAEQILVAIASAAGAYAPLAAGLPLVALDPPYPSRFAERSERGSARTRCNYDIGNEL